MAWTVNGLDFGALLDGNAEPVWLREVDLVTLKLSGTGRSVTYRTGYGPYVLRCDVDFTDASAYATLAGLLGQEVTVSDGTTDWTAIMDVNTIRPQVGYASYAGSLGFRRSAG